MMAHWSLHNVTRTSKLGVIVVYSYVIVTRLGMSDVCVCWWSFERLGHLQLLLGWQSRMNTCSWSVRWSESGLMHASLLTCILICIRVKLPHRSRNVKHKRIMTNGYSFNTTNINLASHKKEFFFWNHKKEISTSTSLVSLQVSFNRIPTTSILYHLAHVLLAAQFVVVRNKLILRKSWSKHVN